MGEEGVREGGGRGHRGRGVLVKWHNLYGGVVRPGDGGEWRSPSRGERGAG